MDATHKKAETQHSEWLNYMNITLKRLKNFSLTLNLFKIHNTKTSTTSTLHDTKTNVTASASNLRLTKVKWGLRNDESAIHVIGGMAKTSSMVWLCVLHFKRVGGWAGLHIAIFTHFAAPLQFPKFFGECVDNSVAAILQFFGESLDIIH